MFRFQYWLFVFATCCSGFASASVGDESVAGVNEKLSALIARCAPTVHPETMSAVISAESRGHQFAIADAGPVNLPWAQRKSMVRSFYPSSLDVAVMKASELIKNGHTVSLGLAQVNDRNLAMYGLSVRDVFDPCANVRVGGKILTDFYKRAVAKFGTNARALNAAISAYNSGDWDRGANDGYVELVYKQVGKPLTINTVEVVPRLPQSYQTVGRSSGFNIDSNLNVRLFTMSSSAFVVSK